MDPRFSKYESFFGRSVDFVREPQPGLIPPISVCRIPLLSGSFFRRFTAPVPDRVVYMTHGMSSAPMRVPVEEAHIYPARIELITYCSAVYVGGHDGQDVTSIALQALANMPFQNEMFFGPMHTAALEEPICPNSEMSAFFFAVPHGVKMHSLCACTPAAELVVCVMPITSSEYACAVNDGPERLLALFEQQHVPNLFDPFRKSVV